MTSLQSCSCSRWNGAPPFRMYFPDTRSSMRPCEARALVMSHMDVSPSTGIDEASAEHTNSLFLVTGKIPWMESSRHVRLFGPHICMIDLLRTSLDPPSFILAVLIRARPFWLFRFRTRFFVAFFSCGGGKLDCRAETCASRHHELQKSRNLRVGE